MEVELLGGGLVVDETYVEEPPEAIRRQVDEYGRGERRSFELTVTTDDSFTGRVMGALLEIPFGETRTYGDLAAALDTAPIAIGGACGRNPVPLVVPCHRVVASDGALRGYSAPGGRQLKRRLLAHERRIAGGVDRGKRRDRRPTSG